jgi:hypothetical protein
LPTAEFESILSRRPFGSLSTLVRQVWGGGAEAALEFLGKKGKQGVAPISGQQKKKVVPHAA